jgi:signal transduction histidine kinase
MSGQWSITLSRRISTSDGRFAGVVFGVIFLEHFKEMFARIDLGPNGVINLRDLDLGTVVRHPEPQAIGTAIGSRTHSKEWPEKLKENPDHGSYFAVGLDGRKRALSFRRVHNFPFYIIVGQLPADYLAEWNQQLFQTLVLVAVFFAVTCWLAWMVASAWRRQQAEVRLRQADHERMLLELHDGSIQSLYAIGLHLENGRRLIQPEPRKAGAILSEAIANLNLVIHDLRSFIAGERALTLTDDEFMEEIHRMLPGEGSERPKFSVDIDRGVVACLNPEQAMHLLRIARETVSNIVRHASASEATLTLRRHGDEVQLNVTDDGVGIAEGTDAGGLGLHHIRARAGKLGGKADLQTAPHHGTRVTVAFPCAA